MRWLLALVFSVCAACELPEDQYVLSGRVVQDGGVAAGVEVRLFRDETASAVRCTTLRPLATATTDEQGRYRFELIRQQVTLGVPERRFFRVEASAGARAPTSSFTFWFPIADAPMPELPLVREDDVTFARDRGFTVFNELIADGHVALRSNTQPSLDGVAQARTVARQFATRSFEIDSLGRADEVPFELRLELPAKALPAGRVPASRGAPCPDLGDECLLTDGRYLPLQLPPGTRTLAIDLGVERVVGIVRFHGLEVDGAPVKVRAEYSFFATPEWSPFNSARIDPALFQEARTHCQEPGASFEVDLSIGRFPRPRWLRLSLPDADGDLVTIRSVQEVIVP